MAETLERRSPQLAAPGWLKTLPAAARWILHTDAAGRALASAAFEVGFSEEACRAVTRGTRATLWLGPDEHLLIDLSPAEAQPAGAAALGAKIEASLKGHPHALVDVGHRQFALEVSGPHAEAILSGGCPLDLDVQAFPVGMCTRTVLAKAEIVIWRTRADAFHLEVWRSFCGYVGGLLMEIAAEYQTA
jgi:sarcosine oxidase, subunit gamma